MQAQKKRAGQRSHNRKRNRHTGRMPAKVSHSNKTNFIIAGVIFLFLLIYIGISFYFMSHFFTHTEINGHSFSGKTAADAENYMQEQVKDYTLTVYEKDNKKDTIKGSDISLTYQRNGQLEKVLKKQNAFLWPLSVFSRKSITITTDLDYDKNALKKAILSLDAVTASQTLPQSARPGFDGTQFVIEPETYGTAVDLGVLEEKIVSRIIQFSPEINLEEENCYAVPAYTSDSEEVKNACTKMNRYCAASITYSMDEPVTVDKTLISSWLTVDDSMNVIFDENAVKKWLEEFADKYDTAGTSRTFTTPDQRTATVSGGDYGWSIDEDTEFENLKAHIENGETLTKEPAYYIGGTAAVHTMPDWGNTFVEVDLSSQHMWYILNGSIALETDVITGEPIPEKITPEGTYSLQDKKRNEVLVGEINPSTGEPSYRTEVNYWMRITWDTGIGLHDATWQRNGFGGTLNQIPDVGSHGCINMPLDQASALYDMIEIGTPVVVHY